MERDCRRISYLLNAAVTVPGGSKHQHRRERLCRYLCRGPIAQECVLLNRQGQVVYRFRCPLRNGVEAVVLDPLTFISRLAALIPHPRQHLLTYHGLFAHAARGRDRVVSGWVEAARPVSQLCRASESRAGQESSAADRPAERYIPWAELLRRVLGIVESTTAVARVLGHMGLGAQPPPRAEVRGVQGVMGWG